MTAIVHSVFVQLEAPKGKALRGNNAPPRGFRGPIEYPKVKYV